MTTGNTGNNGRYGTTRQFGQCWQYGDADRSLPALPVIARLGNRPIKKIYPYSDDNRGAPVSEQAMLCHNCSWGSKKETCAKCGDWIGSHGVQAKLCNECGFGPKKGECTVCGHWIGSEGATAMLCQQCGFSSKKDHCVKCGKWAP